MNKESGMKTKDIVELIIALLIFLVAAYFIYTLLSPKKGNAASSATMVTQVTPLATDFDSGTLQTLGNSSQTQDFYTPPNFQTGLGNNEPFGQ